MEKPEFGTFLILYKLPIVTFLEFGIQVQNMIKYYKYTNSTSITKTYFF